MRTIIKDVVCKNWRIEVVEESPHNTNSITGWLTIEEGCTRFGSSQSFIKYDRGEKDGRIAYDFPEVLPKYVREKLRVILNKMIKERGW